MSYSSGEIEKSFSIEYYYPFPISDLYRKFRFAKASSEKAAYALGLAEITLKLVTVLSMAASYDNPKTKVHIARFQSRLAAATLGTWLNLLRNVSSAILDESDDTNLSIHLREMLRPRGSNPNTFLSEFQGILELRNAFIHGEPMTNAVSEDFLKSISPRLMTALSQLSFLSRYRLAYCEETRKIRSPDCFESTIRLCSGSNPTFQFQIWELDSALDPFVPFLVSQNLDEIYKLSPFLTVQELPSSRNPQIGFFQKLGEHLVWQNYEGRGEATWIGSDSEAGDISNFLSGTFPDTRVPLDFERRSLARSMRLKHALGMMARKDRRPGDLILDRYLPDADEETREQARDVLRIHALLLIRIGERIEAEMAQAGDSPDSAGRLTIEVSDI